MKRKTRANSEPAGRGEQRSYGVAIMLCGLLILLDAVLIAHVAVKGSVVP